MSSRRGFDAALRTHLVYRPSPLVIVTYDDSAELAGILSDIGFQLSSADADVADTRELTLQEAVHQPDALSVVVAPLAEQEETVAKLDAFRDSLGSRTAPLVLLVPRGGAAMERLRTSPYLESWLRGRVLDRQVLESVDEAAERRDFGERAGCTPEAFISAVLGGARDGVYADNMLLQQAQFLAQRAS